MSMEKIRVLYCLDAFEGSATGGTETQFWLLIGALPRDRFDVALALLRPSRYLRENPPPFPVFDIGIQSMASPVSWWRLLRFAFWARRNGYRIAHTYLNDVSICLPPLLRLAGIRVIVSRRDLGFWYSPRILKALRAVRHFVDRVVVNSTAVGEVTMREEGYRSNQVQTIYNGHFCKLGTAAAPANREPRRNRILLCLVANLKPIKRIEDAISALARVRATGEDAGLLLIGGDGRGRNGASYRAELEAHAAALGVSSAVYFLGRVADPAAVVSDADIGVLSSESEGLPNAVIEYMLLEKPSVCTDVGGMRDVVVPGVTGELVPVGDVDAMAGHILRMCREPEYRRKLGQAARVIAEQKFSVSSLTEAHASLYQRTLGLSHG
jgi:glycosyltransferase involved in cell wall biosynthesis